ncbi:MAG TPA: nuclear transport factor 2 family protein [Nitrososphaera sp.]
MSFKKMMMTTPEEVLNSIVEGINAGDLDSLMTLYEADACFASQPGGAGGGGQLAKGPESVRQSLRAFIDLKGKLDLKVKRVLQASDLALVISEWSFSGTGSDGNPVNMAAKKAADVLRRQQADGTWRFVIDNPWGTD